MKALLASLVAVLLAAPAYAGTCDSTVQSYLNWVGSPPSGSTRVISMTITSLDLNGKAEYLSAGLSSYQAAGCGKVGNFFMCWPQRASTPSYTQVFGNWSCVSDTPSGGGFPYCLNPFNEGPDHATVTLSEPSTLGGTGGLTISAQTSGIASASIPLANLSCQNGVMSGFGTAPNSPLYTISVLLNQYAIPR